MNEIIKLNLREERTVVSPESAKQPTKLPSKLNQIYKERNEMERFSSSTASQRPAQYSTFRQIALLT